MSLELLKEEIKVNRVIAGSSTQTIIQNDIIVPDIKPDVSRIYLLDGEAIVKSTDTMQDKIAIYGCINYKILYTSDDDELSIKSINTSTDFTCALDIPGSQQGLRSLVACDIEHIEYDILNGRKVSIKSVLSAKGKVYSEEALDIVTDLDGEENVQVLRNSININSYVGTAETGFSIEEDLDIPAGKPSITELLRNDVKLSGIDYRVEDGKVEVSGNLNISTLYIGDDERHGLEFMEHELPFTQVLELDGASEDAVCSVEYRIDSYEFSIGEDSDGEPRVLAAEIPVRLEVSAFAKRIVDSVEDAYIPGSRLVIDKKDFDIENIVNEDRSQVNLKEVLDISEDGLEISEVFNIMCKPVLTECNVYENRLSVEGIITADILYMTNNAEQPLSCSKQELPFRNSIDIAGIKPGMNAEVQAYIEHFNYSMLSPSELEFRAVLNINSKITDNSSISLIVKTDEFDLEDKRSSPSPSMVLYFVQPGDTLWKVAKKYSSTTEDIININDLSENEDLHPGRQLIVTKKSE